MIIWRGDYMFYRTKDSYIEAFQFDGDLMNAKGKWYVPDWAVNAYQNGILRFEAENMYIEDSLVHVNDYVIYTQGNLYILPQDVFEAIYYKEM